MQWTTQTPWIAQRRNRSFRRGATLIEFALVASILMMMFVGIIQFGQAFFFMGTLNNAAREGARFGSIRSNDVTAIQNKVKRMAAGLDPNRLQVSVTYPDGSTQPTNRITVTVSYPMVNFLPGPSSRTLTSAATARIEKE